MSTAEETADYKLDPNYAVVCSFLERFGKLLYDDTTHLSIRNLDLFLDRQNEETDNVFVKLHQKLLTGIGYTGASSLEQLDKNLIKFSDDFPERDDILIKKLGYDKLPAAVKLRILRNLCEDQFEFNDRFNVKVNGLLGKEEENDGLRHLPLGTDRMGRSYWYIMDTVGNMRLYRSLRNDLTCKESWSLLCSEADGLREVIDTLEMTERVNDDKPDLNETDVVSSHKHTYKAEWMKLTEEEVEEILSNTKRPGQIYYTAPSSRTSEQIKRDEGKHNLKHCFIKMLQGDRKQAETWKTEHEEELIQMEAKESEMESQLKQKSADTDKGQEREDKHKEELQDGNGSNNDSKTQDSARKSLKENVLSTDTNSRQEYSHGKTISEHDEANPEAKSVKKKLDKEDSSKDTKLMDNSSKDCMASQSKDPIKTSLKDSELGEHEKPNLEVKSDQQELKTAELSKHTKSMDESNTKSCDSETMKNTQDLNVSDKTDQNMTLNDMKGNKHIESSSSLNKEYVGNANSEKDYEDEHYVNVCAEELKRKEINPTAGLEMDHVKESTSAKVSPDLFTDDLDMKETLMRISELSGSLTNEKLTSEDGPKSNSTVKSSLKTEDESSVKKEYDVDESTVKKENSDTRSFSEDSALKCTTQDHKADDMFANFEKDEMYNVSKTFDDAIKKLKTLEEIIDQGNTFLSSNKPSNDISINAHLSNNISESTHQKKSAKSEGDLDGGAKCKIEIIDTKIMKENHVESKADLQNISETVKNEMLMKDLTKNEIEMKPKNDHTCTKSSVLNEACKVSEKKKHSNGLILDEQLKSSHVLDSKGDLDKEKPSRKPLSSTFDLSKDVKIELERIDEIFDRKKIEMGNICITDSELIEKVPFSSSNDAVPEKKKDDIEKSKFHKLIVDGDVIEINQLSSDSDFDEEDRKETPDQLTGTEKESVIKTTLSNGLNLSNIICVPTGGPINVKTSLGSANASSSTLARPLPYVSIQPAPNVIRLPKPPPDKKIFVVVPSLQAPLTPKTGKSLLAGGYQPAQHQGNYATGSRSNPILLTTDPQSSRELTGTLNVQPRKTVPVLPTRHVPFIPSTTLLSSSMAVTQQKSPIVSSPFTSQLHSSDLLISPGTSLQGAIRPLLSMRLPTHSLLSPNPSMPVGASQGILQQLLRPANPERISSGLPYQNQRALAPDCRYNVSIAPQNTCVSRAPDGQYYEKNTGRPFNFPMNGRHVVVGFDHKFYDTLTGEVVSMNLPKDPATFQPGSRFFLVPTTTSNNSNIHANQPSKQRAVSQKATQHRNRGRSKKDERVGKKLRRGKKVITVSSDSEELDAEKSDEDDYDYDTISRRVREAKMRNVQKPRKMPRYIEISDDEIEVEGISRQSKRKLSRKEPVNNDEIVEVVDSDEEAPFLPIEEKFELLQYPCTECETSDKSSTILTCTDCNSTYHMGCLTPPLLLLPDSDWFCPLCEHQMLIETLKDKYKELKKVLYAIDRKRNKINPQVFSIDRHNIVESSRSTRLRKEVNYDETKVDIRKSANKSVSQTSPVSELSDNAECDNSDNDGSRSKRTSFSSHNSKRKSRNKIVSPETEETVHLEKSRFSRTRKEVDYDESKFEKMVNNVVKDYNRTGRKKSSDTFTAKSRIHESFDSAQTSSSESESNNSENDDEILKEGKQVSKPTNSSSHKSEKNSQKNDMASSKGRSPRTRKKVNYDESKFDEIIKDAVKDLNKSEKGKSHNTSSTKSKIEDPVEELLSESDLSETIEGNFDHKSDTSETKSEHMNRKRPRRKVIVLDDDDSSTTEADDKTGPTKRKVSKVTRHKSGKGVEGSYQCGDGMVNKAELKKSRTQNNVKCDRKQINENTRQRKQRNAEGDQGKRHLDLETDSSLSETEHNSMDTDKGSEDTANSDEITERKKPEDHIYYTSSGRRTNSLSNLKNVLK